MYHVRPDTLAGIKQSAIFSKRDFSNIPMAQFMDALKEYESGAPGMRSPEGEAIKFYYANHVFTLLSIKFDDNEVLPEPYADLARLYVKMSGELICRLVYYTMMIITREMRHCPASSGTLYDFASSQKVVGEMVSFILSIKNDGEHGAIVQLKNAPPNVTVAEYCNAMDHVFEFGGFSGGYGNKPWAIIAETLGKLCKGVLTAEMFADVAFTLCHNNGPMFNKGMLYTDFSKPMIYRILDVQRSGQVPQLFHSELQQYTYLDADGIAFVQKALPLFREELAGYVDWYKVEALGSLHKYPHEKKVQVMTHGPSPYVDKLPKSPSDNKFFVGALPHEFVLTYKRKKAA